MRILYLVPDPGIPLDGRKGASRHARSVVAALGALGHEVSVLAVRPGDLEDPRLGRIDAGKEGGFARFEAAERFLERNTARIARTLRPEVVIERLSLFPRAGFRIARRAGALHVLEVNAPLADEMARHRGLADVRRARLLEERAIRAADLVVCVSRALSERARALRARAGGSRSVLHLPNGTDTSLFLAASGRRRSARASLGLGPRDPCAVFLGSLKPWHGLDVLARTAALAARRRPGLRLLVIGDGPGRTKLEEQTGRIEGLAAIFTGAVEPERVPLLLQAADVGLATYPPLEGFYFSPLKVAEYAAAGLPVVASDLPDVRDLLSPADGLVPVPPGDAEAAADALVALLEDPERRRRLGEAARGRAVCRLDWTHRMEQLVARIRALRRCAESRP